MAHANAGRVTSVVSLVSVAVAKDSAAAVPAQMVRRGEYARTNARSSHGVTRLSRKVHRV